MLKSLFWLYALSAIVYFGQGIEGLPGQSVFYFLKETLHFNEQKIMFIGSIITLAWLLKPFIGYMVDSLGITKKWFILLSTIISALICMVVGLSPVLALPLIVGLMMFASFNAALRDVTVDGIMCIEGKKQNLTGKIQSIQWIAITIAGILTGVGGGYMAEHYSYQIAYLCLIPFYLLMLGFTLQYNETPVPVVQKSPLWPTLKTLFQDKNLLLFSLFVFLYNFSPSFGTPLMFIQRDEFHWSKLWIGWLGTIGAICSIIGAWLYWKYSKKIDLNKWLYYSVWIGAFNTLCYMWFNPVTCVIYDVIDSVTGMFIQLLVLDFMARKTKIGMEAMSFALLCSVTNFASTCNGFVGGWLFPILGLKWLIIISAGASFLCLPLLKRIKI